MTSRLRTNFAAFFFYVKKYKTYYLIGSLAVIIVDLLEILPPLILKNVVDTLSDGKPEVSFFLLAAGSYISVSICQGIMRFIWRWFIIRTSMKAGHDIRQDLFVHLSTLAPGFFKKNRIGDLVSLNSNDAEMFRFALGPGFLITLDAICVFATIPPIMVWLSPKLTLITLLPMLIIPFFIYKMENSIHRLYRRVQDQFSNLSAYGQESLNGIRLIKANSLETRKESDFHRLGNDYIKANIHSRIAESTLNIILEFIVNISLILLFMVGGKFVMADGITIGVFVAFHRYIAKMIWPMEALGLSVLFLERGFAAQDRIREVKDEKAEIIKPAAPIYPEPQSALTISIKNLWFQYPGNDTPTLKNINISIKPGKRYGIIGKVGSGKSTLLACLSRLEPVERNMVFINGIDINDIDPLYVREKIAMVTQDPLLFSETIKDNIVYGNPVFEKEANLLKLEIANQATQLAHVQKDIYSLPDQMETLLGERGVNLSGGQKQRITIARAIAQETEFFLFDDCLSAVDAETESKLVDSLDKSSKNKTLILTSHRFSSIENLDWIFILENGEVIEQGSPKTLLTKNMTLQNIFYHQTSLQEEVTINEST